MARNGLSGLLGGGGLADIMGQPAGSERGHIDTIDENSFDTWSAANTAGEWSDIGIYTVPFQTEESWGFGSAEPGKSGNQGRIMVDLRDGSAAPGVQLTGKVRLVQRNANDRNERTVAEFNLKRLNDAGASRTEQQPLPEQVNNPKVGPQSKLVLQAQLDGTAASQANSEVLIDTTVYE